MRFYTAMMFAFAPLIFVLGCYILWLNVRETAHRLFFVISLDISIWMVLAVFIFLTDDPDEAWFWFRLASTFGIVFFPLLAHFCLLLNGPNTILRIKIIIILVYALSLPVHVSNLTGTYIFDRISLVHGDWVFSPAVQSFWMYYWISYSCGILAFCLILLHLRKRRAQTPREKKQLHTVLVFLAVGTVLGLAEAYVVAPLLEIPPLTPFYVIIILSGIWFAMLKYRLLSITDKRVCRDILETLDAAVVMLDFQERVVMLNRAAEAILQTSRKKAAGRAFYEIIGDNDAYRQGIEDLKAGRLPRFACQIDMPCGTGTKERIQLDLSLSPARDRTGDPLGFIALGRESKGLRQFLRRFHITAREWEAIHKLASGVANREIARSLCIAERTVKAHLSSAYGKLGVDNKVQLITVLRKYDLF